MRAGAKPKITEKWERFTAAVREYIASHNGIASICEVFEAGKETGLRLPWTTPKLEEVAHVLVKNNEFFRIDLNIPGGKPLAIYPGHHKVTSTTFFVPNAPGADHAQSVERAKAMLDSLVEEAQRVVREKKAQPKPKRKRNRELDAPKPLAYSPNQFRAKECMANGYIAMRSVQHQILHLFLLQTYGGRTFEMSDIMRDISVDLVLKLVGVKDLPSVFLLEPRLRFLTLGCLPAAMKDQLCAGKEAEKIMQKLLLLSAAAGKGKAQYAYTVLKNPKSARQVFELLPSAKVEFEGQFTKIFDCRTVEGIVEYHRALELFELMEFIDPHTNDLWSKRYTMMINGRNAPTTLSKQVVRTLVKEPYDVTWPYFHFEVEDFVKATGLNWITLQSTLLQLFERKKDSDKKKSSMKEEIEQKRCSTKTRAALFLKGTEEFEPNPESLFDKKSVDDFMFLKGLDLATILNNLVASAVFVANGVITKLPRPWTVIRGYLETLSTESVDDWTKRVALNNLHRQFLTLFKDYRDLYEYNVACNVRNQISKMSTETLTLTTQEFNNAMNLATKRLQVPVELGELIERLKIVLLCPPQEFAGASARHLLNEIRNSGIDEAVFYLKLTQFLTQNMSKDGVDKSSRYRCTKKALQEIALARPLAFYSSLLDYITFAKDPTKRGLMESTPGACTFFLDLDADMYLELDLPAALPVEIVQTTKQLVRQSMTDILRKQRYGMPKGANIVVSNHRIGLPTLPDCVARWQFPTKEQLPSLSGDFRDYPGCTCSLLYQTFMQLFVIIYQTQSPEDTPQMTIIARLLYAFILSRCSVGASLIDILEEYQSYAQEAIIQQIALLEQCEFIYRIHSMHVFPVFVADVYAHPHLIPCYNEESQVHAAAQVRPHFWVALRGVIDQSVRERLQMKICDIVDTTPGIEIMEVAAMMCNLALADLIHIVDVLELDEVIYTVYSKSTEGGLDVTECDGICAPCDMLTFMLMVGRELMDPSEQRIHRKLFPTRHNQKNLALALSRSLASET